MSSIYYGVGMQLSSSEVSVRNGVFEVGVKEDKSSHSHKMHINGRGEGMKRLIPRKRGDKQIAETIIVHMRQQSEKLKKAPM